MKCENVGVENGTVVPSLYSELDSRKGNIVRELDSAIELSMIIHHSRRAITIELRLYVQYIRTVLLTRVVKNSYYKRKCEGSDHTYYHRSWKSIRVIESWLNVLIFIN